MVQTLCKTRAPGRITVLATAADDRVAQACARELGLFDQVVASDGARNLKAGTKAEQLVATVWRTGL